MAARSAPSCGLVPLHHAGRDAPALTDHDAVVFRPRPDVTAVLPAGLSTSRSARLRSPGLAGVLKVRRELLAERGGVAGPQVDLIAGAIDGEPDGLIGRAAVEVVFECDGYFLGHSSLPAAVVLAPYPGPRSRPSRNASDQAYNHCRRGQCGADLPRFWQIDYDVEQYAPRRMDAATWACSALPTGPRRQAALMSASRPTSSP